MLDNYFIKIHFLISLGVEMKGWEVIDFTKIKNKIYILMGKMFLQEARVSIIFFRLYESLKSLKIINSMKKEVKKNGG